MRTNKLQFKTLGTLAVVLAFVPLGVACSSSSKPSGTGAQTAVGGVAGTVSATASNSTPEATKGAQASSSGQALLNLAGVVDQAKPSTVQITSSQVQINQLNQPFTTPSGVGSGVIYDSNGDILTNSHVVAGSKQLEVALPDGRSFPGTLVGADPQSDLAVVRISGSNIPVAKLGDSAKLRVGDWTVAIGNALALPGGPTVTVGVVSALERSVQEPAQGGGSGGAFLFGLIQTSAQINPGNSGGPLVNLGSEVIGINTLVAGEAEPGVQAQGIGFAIAINSAKAIADQITSGGQVRHAFLGVEYVPLTPAIASQLGVKVTQGAVVVDAAAGSPAAAAGLKRGDVITQVDGQNVVSESDLARYLSQHKPGDTVKLTVQNGSDSRTVTVTLGQAPTPTSGP